MNRVSPVSFMKLSWLVRSRMGVYTPVGGRLRRTRPLNSAAADRCVCPMVLLAKTWGSGGTLLPNRQFACWNRGASAAVRQYGQSKFHPADGGIQRIVDVNPLNCERPFLTLHSSFFDMDTQKRLGTPSRCAQAFFTY